MKWTDVALLGSATTLAGFLIGPMLRSADSTVAPTPPSSPAATVQSAVEPAIEPALELAPEPAQAPAVAGLPPTVAAALAAHGHLARISEQEVATLPASVVGVLVSEGIVLVVPAADGVVPMGAS